MAEDALRRAAETTVERLGVRAGESFLVVYNDAQADVAEAIAEAARRITSETRALAFPALTRNGEEPPDEVAEALLAADAAALVTAFSLSHTIARLEATKRGARIASMPRLTAEMFARTLPVDYAELESAGRALAARLTAAESCRIVAPSGTDLVLDLRGRTGVSDDGDLREPGSFGNLPAGEAYTAPVETGANGTIVFDASIASSPTLLDAPLRARVEGGRLVEADGAAGATLLASLDAGGPNGRVIAELGIGTNPSATITGNILEDEKAAGTIHIAFGTNTGIGGRNQASVHIDGLVRSPTVELDGEAIMRDGRVVS